jgi:hypothetical protein
MPVASQEIDMVKLGKVIGAGLFLAGLLAAASGCQKKEGPLEQAGKELDQAIENVVEPKTGPAEQAGQAVDNAAETAGQKIEQAVDNVQDAAK